MIEIYTDASFNEDNKTTNIIAGIGFIKLEYNHNGDILNEEYVAKRYEANDLIKYLDFKCLKITNCLIEFIALFEIFELFNLQEEEIHIYTDWHVTEMLFNNNVETNNILNRNPNLKHLLKTFKSSIWFNNNLCYVHTVKGHSGDKNNVMADFLAKYKYKPKDVINIVLNNIEYNKFIEEKVKFELKQYNDDRARRINNRI